MLENAVAESVPGDISRCARCRQIGRRPEPTAVFISDIQSLAGGIRNRVVIPRGQPELVCVLAPGVTAAAFGNNRAKASVCQDIDPGRRRGMMGHDNNDIFTAVRSEPAGAVKEDQVFLRFDWYGARLGTERLLDRQPGQDAPGILAALNIFGQLVLAVGNDYPGGC